MSKKTKATANVHKSRTSGTGSDSFFSIEFLKKTIETREKQILLFLIVVAFLIRVYRLGFLSFWVDEYMHVNRAVSFLKDFNPSHIFQGEKNGLLVTLLNVVGFVLFGKNEFGGRIFIVLIGTALVPVIYYFCKIIFNRPVAFMAAILVVFSQYLIHWSRLDRQYGPIPTMYLLLVLSAVLYVQRAHFQAPKFSVLGRFNIDIGTFGFLVGITFLSFATNFISYFIGFSLGVYCIVLWLSGLISKSFSMDKKNIRIILIALASLFFFVLSFSPLNAMVLKPLFQRLMPENMVNLILPNFEYIKTKLVSAEKFNQFKVYWGVITTDLPYMIYIALAGLLSLALLHFRKFIILFSFYVPPFLLMSFVFLDPCLPRYHTFIYPLFLISVACGFYYLPNLISGKLAPGNQKIRNNSYYFSILGFLIMLIVSKALINPFKLITNENHGAPIDRKLSIWYFTNWKEPSLYIKKNIKKGDVVLSTVPDAVNFYINQQDQYQVHLFRQMRLDTETRNFVLMGHSSSIPSASSVEDLYKTMESFNRVWLIADYYLYNSLTDPKARDLVFKNFTLYPGACKDGSVQLFLWDRNQAKKFQHNTLLEMGKPTGRQVSPGLGFNVNQTHLSSELGVTIESTGIDSDKEAYLHVNNTEHYAIPKPKRIGQNNLGISELKIPGNKLKLGQNILTVKYNPTKPDLYKGFIIYNIDFK